MTVEMTVMKMKVTDMTMKMTVKTMKLVVMKELQPTYYLLSQV